MTIPEERRRAVILTRRFLADLLDAKATPLVPRPVRVRAHELLKHYPTETDMDHVRRAFLGEDDAKS